jgi:hypothetical protein
LARRIADLDSGDFAVRHQARAELEALGEAAEAALRRVLKESPSAEVRRQARELVDKIRVGRARPSGGRLRPLRAVEALEQAATPAARRLLAELARGEPGAGLTREAKAALGRLAGRPASLR